jgi:serine protease
MAAPTPRSPPARARVTLSGVRHKSSFSSLVGFAFLLLLPMALVAPACTVTEAPSRKANSHPNTDAGTGGEGAGGAGAGGAEAGGRGSGAAAGATDGGKQPGGDASDASRSDAGATVSGTLKLSDLLFVDSDAADPGRPPKSNDTPTDAQTIASPGLVGGYLGVTSLGPDATDVFTVALGGSEALTLYIAAPTDGSPRPDFDLGLYDSNGTPVDTSAGTGSIEMVKATAPGTYYVAVVAATASDAGLYTLAIASAPSANAVRAAAHDRLNAAWPLVPGEALVKLRPHAAAKLDVFARLGVHPLSSGMNAVGYYRVALDPVRGTKTTPGAGSVHDGLATILAIKRLRASPDVAYAEPNYRRSIHAAPPNDPLFSSQWNYRNVNLLDAWDHTKGAGTIVAVLDTGAKKAHPDFVNADASSQLLAGYDMIADPTTANDGDGRDANSDDPGDRELVTDSSWHGSHVAGTVAAATGNAIGCAGIAPATKILPVRVLGVGGGTVDDIVQGILYAAGLQNDAGVLPARRADVINMSLGGPGLSQATADAIQLARGAGTVVVASAGNDATDASFYSPAGEAGVVTVSAVDLLEQAASYSNYGSVVDVAAPGGDDTTDQNGDGIPDGVLSLVYSNNGKTLYTPYEGTSMASPHVSGIVALMKAVYPALSPDELDKMLAGTAGVGPITQDLGVKGRDDSFGNGLINANLAVLSALEAASQPTTTTPLLQLSATALDFGALDVMRTFDIANVGRGTLTVTSVTADQPWITIAPRALGTNTVTVDRTGLASGVHSGVVTVTTNGGTKTVDVRVTVASATAVPGGDVGIVYVLLVDPTTNAFVAETSTSIADGYAFSLPNVPAGDYELVAGTDLDNSGIVNDDGEAFGAYPVTSGPQIVHVGKDQTGLSFPLRFLFDVQAASTGTTGARPRFAH